MNPFETEMNKALQKLAVDIIPSDERLAQANKIVKLLQTRSKFKIDRVCIAGSAGKKTTIINSDIDCVLFINGEQPPFKDILEDFEDILNISNSYKIRNVRKTKYSVQFKALDIEFDVLPATNFTEGLRVGGDKLIDIQQQEVLAIIGQDPKKYNYMYSSSLTEATVRFMKNQDGFVNEMVRIAKFWYNTLHFPDYVSGAKSCIELVAVYAANQEERMQTKSHLRSFSRFIDHLQRFDNLDIHFGNSRWHQHQPPCVMDPVNPYNNLAENWDPKSIQLIKGYATETIRRLQASAHSDMVHLDQIFEPQPVYRFDMSQIYEYRPTQKSQWLVDTTTFSLLPDLKVRDEKFHTTFELWVFLDVLQKYFQSAIFAANASNRGDNYMQKAVENTIARQVCNAELTWSSTDEKHEDYDVTFTIPSSSGKAVRVSFRQ